MSKEKVINKKNASKISYSGKVVTKLLNKNKQIDKKVLFNTGTSKLFEMIALFMVGQYPAASNLQIQQLNLFTVANVKELNPATDLDPKYRKNLIVLNKATAPGYSEIKNEDNEVVGYSVTFKFTIPLVAVNDLDNINVLGLYAPNQALPSAYVVLKGEDDEDGKLIPDDAGIDTGDLNDYVLSIQWEMQFVNGE